MWKDDALAGLAKTPRVDPADTFSRVAHRSVAADAVEQIKHLIASGVLSPGQKLPSERALADLLGVSRPTMREVVRALEAMGVVSIRHGSGTFVTSLNAEVIAGPLTFILDFNHSALEDLFGVRILLEAGAAHAAAATIDEDLHQHLETLIEAMRSAHDADGLLVPDLAFHRVIHEAAENSILLALMDSLRVLTRQSLLASATHQADREAAIEEHHAIVNALRQRDGEAAAAAMREHIENARQRAERTQDFSVQPSPDP